MNEIDPAVVMVVWAALGLVLMVPLILVTWLAAYDDLKKRWGK